MASLFASSPKQEIEKLLEDKDSMILSLDSALDCFIRTVKIQLFITQLYFKVFENKL